MRRTAGSLARLGLGALLLGTACGHNYRGWAVSRTRNVNVYTDTKLEHEFIQEWLELSHSALRAFFPGVATGQVDVVWLQWEPGGGTRVYGPLANPQAGWTLETMPSGSGPIGQSGLIVLERKDEMTVGPSGFGFRSTRDENLAKRQMAHLFIMKAVPMAPLWLQVGLAHYLAKFRIHYKGNDWTACFGSSVFDEPPQFDTPVRNGRRVNIELGDLFGADWYAYDSKRRYWYEYTAYGLVHYLIHGDGGFNRTRFPLLLKAMREGQSTADALATAYPQILPGEWEERLAVHMRPARGKAMIAATPQIRQGLCMAIPAATDAEKKPRREPVSGGEIEALMNELERVDIFKRHSAWVPHDVVEAEAAKRPRRRNGPPGPGRGDGDRAAPPGPGPSAEPPVDDGSTPILRVPPPPPPS